MSVPFPPGGSRTLLLGPHTQRPRPTRQGGAEADLADKAGGLSVRVWWGAGKEGEYVNGAGRWVGVKGAIMGGGKDQPSVPLLSGEELGLAL